MSGKPNTRKLKKIKKNVLVIESRVYLLKLLFLPAFLQL